MNRLEELTLKSADDCLTQAEAEELRTCLDSSVENQELYFGLLELEAALRGRRTNCDLTQATLERLQKQVTDAIAGRVMESISSITPAERKVLRADFRQRARFPGLLAMAASIAILLALAFWLFGAKTGRPVLTEVQGNVTLVRNDSAFSPQP